MEAPRLLPMQPVTSPDTGHPIDDETKLHCTNVTLLIPI